MVNQRMVRFAIVQRHRRTCFHTQGEMNRMAKNLPPKWFVIHASATYPDMDIDIEWIRNIHVNQNNWSDVAYHFFIKRDGTLQNGRPIERIGAHALGHNVKSIGICMAGGLKPGTKIPEDNFTQDQFDTLYELLDQLHNRFPEARIIGHNGFENHRSRGCPCFDWKDMAKWKHQQWGLDEKNSPDTKRQDDQPAYKDPDFGSNVETPKSTFQVRETKPTPKPKKPQPEVVAPKVDLTKNDDTGFFGWLKRLFA